MKLITGRSPASIILRVKLMDSSSTTGAGLTGLAYNTSNLKVSTIKIGEASATTYSGSNLETISTLGTYAAPTSGKARFKEVDATNHPGIYEIQLADARFSATGSLLVSVSGATNLAQADFEIQCNQFADDQAATPSYKSLSIVNSAGTAVLMQSTGSDGNGLAIYGYGAGDGIDTNGGATGHGVHIQGGATSGHGITISCSGASNDAINLTGQRHGINSFGSGGCGIYALAGGSGYAGITTTGGSNAAGFKAVGTGTGSGIASTGGATGNGVTLDGGATSGHALSMTSTGASSNGINIEAKNHGIYTFGSAGLGIYAKGLTGGVTMEASSANNHGLYCKGYGEGSGIQASAGSSGNGITSVGGATAGNGIFASGMGYDASGLRVEGLAAGFYCYGSSGYGIYADGQGGGAHFKALVGNTNGLRITGNSGGTGLVIVGGNSNAHAIEATGTGTGCGMSLTGGSYGSGLQTVGGSLGGQGINAVAQCNSGCGIRGYSVAGYGANFAGNYGMYCQGSDQAGISAISNGSGGAGLYCTGPYRALEAREIGAPVSLDGGTASLAGMLTKMADDNGGADFDATTDSLEKISSNMSSIISVSAIADAVWDEVRSGHTTSGTFGQGIASVQGNVTGNVNGNVNGSVDSVTDPVTVGTNNDKTGYALTTGDKEAIADTVCDETVASHQTSGSVGWFINLIRDQNITTQSDIEDVQTAVDAITAKLPAGMLGDLTLDTQIDGVPFSEIMEYLMTMANGRFKINTPESGKITFYKRDNVTPMFIVNVTESERTRQ